LFYIATNGVARFVSSSIIPMLNKWNHFAFVLKGTNGSMYINGELVGNGYLAPPRIVSMNTSFFARSVYYPSDALANAVYDDLKIFNKGLSKDEVLKVQNSF
jgi:hypothetical protein